MRQTYLKACILICFISIIAAVVPAPAAHAGLFDRIKDIYNTPEKISQLETQYEEAKEALAEQQEQLEESLRAAEEYALRQKELLEQNEQFRQQNEKLIAQNEALQAEVAHMQQERKTLIRKLINTVIILFSVFLLYLASVRIWRYLVWRSQRADSKRRVIK
ncbi:hypothetical protein D3C78_1342080 [compost metagenome]